MINQPSSFSQQKNNSNNRSKPDQSIIFDATPGNDTSDDFVDFEIDDENELENEEKDEFDHEEDVYFQETGVFYPDLDQILWRR